MLELEFTLYESTGILELPGQRQITVKERRTSDEEVTRVTLDCDPPLEDSPEPTRIGDTFHVDMDDYRPSSIERTWSYVIRNESGEIVYRGEIENLFVRNTSTDREFRQVSFEVGYCGPGSEERSFRITGTEMNREKAEKAMLLFAERDAGRRC